jgi:hypothetical protein
MTTQLTDLARLAERLDQLERRNDQLARWNRWLRGAFLATVLSVGLAALTLHNVSAAPAKADTTKPTLLTATGLHIVDGSGRTRVSLTVGSDNSAGIILYRPGKDIAGNFFVDKEGNPQLHMFDTAKNRRQILGINSDGQPNLTQFDRTGTPRASYFLDKDQASNVVLFDSGKVRRAWLNVASGFPETPALGLYDARGTAIWVAK